MLEAGGDDEASIGGLGRIDAELDDSDDERDYRHAPYVLSPEVSS